MKLQMIIFSSRWF